MYRLKRVVIAFILVSIFAVGLFAGDLFAEEVDLKVVMERIEKLEMENQVLKEELSDIKSQIQRADAPGDKLKGKNLMVTGSPVSIEMYGYIKADAAYGDSQIGASTMSAPLEGTSKDNDEFVMTAEQTRLGFKLTGPKIGDNGDIVGKIEGDFWGGNFRLRQAYVKFKYPAWDVLAGQAWDFFSPIAPDTVNFGALWRSGNIGDRHPQLTFTRRFQNVLGGDFAAQIGLIDSKVEEQRDRGLPLLGMYNSLEREAFGKPVTIGLGGLIGESDISTSDSKNVLIWANTLVLKAKLSDMISVTGEGYIGAGLAAFRGGSPTAIDHSKPVRSGGGWMQLSLKPTKRLQLNFGGGIDDVYTDSTSTGTDAVWDYNYSHFCNLKYELTANLSFGLEYQRFITKYTQQAGGDANRFMSSLTYKF